MKIKIGVSVVLLFLVSAIAYSYSGLNINPISKTEEIIPSLSVAVEKTENHDHQAMVSQTMTIIQDQDQQPSPPNTGHRISPGDGCSSVNPNSPNKDRNGVKKNTVGCKCVRKCVAGQTVEDLSRDKNGVYVCENACHKDRCSCPDPCKS